MALDPTVASNMSMEERALYFDNPPHLDPDGEAAFKTHANVAAPFFPGEVNARTLLSTIIDTGGAG
eukprot:12929863-Prorocentrum_lima.AAC.1